ncbi:MAG: hypothetical protein RLY43_1605 [Bacteroidota bacterium]|jgi:hypothetical protein
MRISKFSKDYRVKEETLIRYFEELNWNYSSFNKKLTENEIEKLIEHHKSYSSKKKSSKIIVRNEITKDFEVANPFLSQVSNLYQKNNLANNDDNSGKNNFQLNDFTAFAICDGLQNLEAKYLCKRFNSGDIDDELISAAHQLAAETISRYGKETILELVKLPKLPFKASNFHQVFSELDKKRGQVLDPSIRIIVNEIPLHISFYKEEENGNKSIYKNIIIVRDKLRKQELFKMTRQGDCIPKYNSAGIIPIIQTFVSYSSEIHQHILHYGLVTGECSICGRPLSDPESIRLGIGPICRQGILL